MEGSVPNLRLHITALLEGIISLDAFQRWFAAAEAAIEIYGSDADVDLASTVFNRLAEYTGEHISAQLLLNVLQEDVSSYTTVQRTSTNSCNIDLTNRSRIEIPTHAFPRIFLNWDQPILRSHSTLLAPCESGVVAA